MKTSDPNPKGGRPKREHLCDDGVKPSSLLTESSGSHQSAKEMQGSGRKATALQRFARSCKTVICQMTPDLSEPLM